MRSGWVSGEEVDDVPPRPPVDGGPLDWGALAASLTDELDDFARATLDGAGGERVYAVAVHLFHAEPGGAISLPVFAAAGEEWLDRQAPEAREELRWSAADWPWQRFDDWREPGSWLRWGERVTAEAVQGGLDRWHAVHRRFLDTVVRACERVAAGLARDFPRAPVVVPLDPEVEPRGRAMRAWSWSGRAGGTSDVAERGGGRC